MTAKNILKQWFSNGKKPTQDHFWEWIDSFWHKDEKIKTTDVEGLDDSLSDKVSDELFRLHLQDKDAHGIDKKADITYVDKHIERLEKDFKNIILEAENGTKYQLSVENDGTLVTTLIL